jgi:hypothetical protein
VRVYRRILFIGAICGILFGHGHNAHAASSSLLMEDEQAITCNAWNFRAPALDGSREIGTRVVRVNLIQWHPGCPARYNAAEAIAQAGMHPQLTLAGELPYLKAQVLAHRDVVSTYAIWNEPDLGVWQCCHVKAFGSWGGMGDMADYRRFYKRAYRMVKRLDPARSTKVCIWETSPHGMLTKGKTAKRWVARSLRKRHPIRTDCVAIHPYFWLASKRVDRRYYRWLLAFKRSVTGYARKRMLCRPGRGRCKAPPIYSTENGMPRQDGDRGDAKAIGRMFRICRKLHFKQCAQYMLMPAITENHSRSEWQTSLIGFNCRPLPTYYALARANGHPLKRSKVDWPPCPQPIPGVSRPLPPKWGTPAWHLGRVP